MPKPKPLTSVLLLVMGGTVLALVGAAYVSWTQRGHHQEAPRPATRPADGDASRRSTSGPASKAATRPRDELEGLLDKVDAGLYEQCSQDMRAWLDQRVRQEIGGILPDAWHVKYRGDAAYVQMTHGAVADMAAQLFRAHEVLGEAKYRDAALRTCEFLLKAQQPRGYWLTSYVSTRSGKVGAQSSLRTCRIADGCQFRPFALLLYAHRLTGEARFLEAATRCADCVLALEDPVDGSWPDSWEFPRSSTQPAGPGPQGLRVGGSYAEFATTDAMRMMIMAYHATGERSSGRSFGKSFGKFFGRKYLAGLGRLGEWLMRTQIGRGRVCGWCPRYDTDGQPLPAPGHDTPVIDPSLFNRCTAPMLGWFYGLTGEGRYLSMLRDAVAWLRSVQRPEGWAQEYLPDGTEVFSYKQKVWRYGDPAAPQDAPGAVYSRDFVQLDDAGQVLNVIAAGGREGLVRWHAGPTVLAPAQYRTLRLAAARRATDPQRLAQVRKRWLRQDAPDLPKRDWLGRAGVDRQAWHSIHTWKEPYHAPPGHAQWQFVCDVRLARGEITADAAATGGRGLEAMHLYEPWDVMGDWTQRAIDCASWLAVPREPAWPSPPTPSGPATRANAPAYPSRSPAAGEPR